MSFFELLVLMGVDPNIRPAKAIIWFSSVMAIGIALMFLALLATALTGSSMWFLAMIPFFVVTIVSGHVFHIFDASKDRSAFRVIGRFMMAFMLAGVNRERPIASILAWQVSGLIFVSAIGYFSIIQWLSTGQMAWQIAPLGGVAVFYLVGRLFGHFR